MTLPNPGMSIDSEHTALVITDPQNDFLSPEGVTWGVVGESVTENNTVENIEALLKAAQENGMQVFISPHYYYPSDHGWKEVAVVKDATAAAKVPEGDGYQTALVNYRFMANTAWSTEEAANAIKHNGGEAITAS
jgi:nicotinamidase-related amidase